jgi:hypothetical protein
VDALPSFRHPECYGDAPDEDPVKDDDDVEIGDECKAETEVESDKVLDRAMQDGLPAEKKAELRRIGSKHADVFWTRLAADPAVDDKPVQNAAGGGSVTATCQCTTTQPTATGILGRKGEAA